VYVYATLKDTLAQGGLFTMKTTNMTQDGRDTSAFRNTSLRLSHYYYYSFLSPLFTMMTTKITQDGRDMIAFCTLVSRQRSWSKCVLRAL
jgi:hypothetical protein